MLPGMFGMTGAEFFSAVFPFYLAAIFAVPGFFIAFYLRGVWKHMKYQTALLEGRIRPVHEAPAQVTDLDSRRRNKANQ